MVFPPQYTHTAPRDDWVVVDHGLVAPSKSSDVDLQPESGSWEIEEDEDASTLEMEVNFALISFPTTYVLSQLCK